MKNSDTTPPRFESPHPLLVPRICYECEYFDIGTMAEDGHSDCLNRLSPRFQTYAHETCIHWVEGT